MEGLRRVERELTYQMISLSRDMISMGHDTPLQQICGSLSVMALWLSQNLAVLTQESKSVLRSGNIIRVCQNCTAQIEDDKAIDNRKEE
jgi:hypothetical protein